MRSFVVGAVVAAVTFAIACSVDVDVTNKACPCGSGFVCDPSRNVCVVSSALANATARTPTPSCDPCPCTADKDCTDPTRLFCSPTTKTCVECNPADDKCGLGSYCNDKAECTAGCRNDADCGVSPGQPHCSTTRHQCVQCLTSANCPNAETCSPSGTCVQSCGTGKGCDGGGECCQGLCTDTKTDVLDCGACDQACALDNATPACGDGQCSWKCASGFAHCSADNTGCETNIRTDLDHCGACDVACTKGPNVGEVVCASARCAIAKCVDGFVDKDKDPKNGCETTCGHKGETCCAEGVCVEGHCTGSGKCE